jgi:hypothetical protein
VRAPFRWVDLCIPARPISRTRARPIPEKTRTQASLFRRAGWQPPRRARKPGPGRRASSPLISTDVSDVIRRVATARWRLRTRSPEATDHGCIWTVPTVLARSRSLRAPSRRWPAPSSRLGLSSHDEQLFVGLAGDGRGGGWAGSAEIAEACEVGPMPSVVRGSAAIGSARDDGYAGATERDGSSR